jgi:hypothetical protein
MITEEGAVTRDSSVAFDQLVESGTLVFGNVSPAEGSLATGSPVG